MNKLSFGVLRTSGGAVKVRKRAAKPGKSGWKKKERAKRETARRLSFWKYIYKRYMYLYVGYLDTHLYFWVLYMWLVLQGYCFVVREKTSHFEVATSGARYFFATVGGSFACNFWNIKPSAKRSNIFIQHRVCHGKLSVAKRANNGWWHIGQS